MKLKNFFKEKFKKVKKSQLQNNLLLFLAKIVFTVLLFSSLFVIASMRINLFPTPHRGYIVTSLFFPPHIFLLRPHHRVTKKIIIIEQHINSKNKKSINSSRQEGNQLSTNEHPS